MVKRVRLRALIGQLGAVAMALTVALNEERVLIVKRPTSQRPEKFQPIFSY